MPIALPSMVALMLAVLLLIIIRLFFSACKKLTVYTEIFDIQLYLQNFKWANNNWMLDHI